MTGRALASRSSATRSRGPGWQAPRLRAPRMRAPIVALAILAALPPLPARAATEPLVVFAGAGFRLPIEDAARAFTTRSGTPVELTFAGSGCLLAQAELSGRGDVLIPGELHYLAQAQERGLAGRGVSLAYLRPVIAVRAGNPLGIRGLADLGRANLRLGLGDARSVAVGMVAERWIAKELSPRERAAVLGNVRTRALNVNELGSQLALGALDAAIVWDATVALYEDLAAVAPASGLAHRALVTGAVLSIAKQPEAGARFLSFLAGPEGAAIFRARGYQPYSVETAAHGMPTP